MTVRDSGLARALPAANQHRWMRSFLVPALVVLLAFAALMPFLPNNYLMPSYAYSINQYIGVQILNGRLPYVDIWQNSPPLVFYINALGLGISGGSVWGIWLLEFCSLSAFGLVLFSFLRRYFTIFPAAVAVAAILVNLIFLNSGGNIPEEYGLLFQVILLALLAREDQSVTSSRLRLISIGAVTGLSFSLRFTLVGTGLVTVLFLLVRRLRSKDLRCLLDLLWVAFGFLVVCAAWAAYLLGSRSLPDFLEQVVRFNWLYAGVTNTDRLEAFRGALAGLNSSALFFTLTLLAWLAVGPFLLLNDGRFRDAITARVTGGIILILGAGLIYNGLHNDVGGWLLGLGQLSFYRWVQVLAGVSFVLFGIFVIGGGFRRIMASVLNNHLQPVSRTDLFLPLTFALACLPVELILASFRGQTELSFFVPAVPSLGILLAFVLWSLVPKTKVPLPSGYTGHLLQFVVIVSILWFGLAQTFSAARLYHDPELQNMVNFIHQKIRSDETVLQWDLRVPGYAMPGRDVPSRYLSIQPLLTKGYTSTELVKPYLGELETLQPEYIVDKFSGDFPLLYVDNKSQCDDLMTEDFQQYLVDRALRMNPNLFEKRPGISVEAGELFRYVCRYYEPVATFDAVPATIYRRSQSKP